MLYIILFNFFSLFSSFLDCIHLFGQTACAELGLSLSLCSTQASGHHLSFFLNHSASIQSLLFVILAYNSTAFNTQCAFADAAAFSFTSSDSAPIVVGFALHFDDH